MEVFLMSFAVIALAIAGMSVGVLAGRPPIAGSCGGACEVCAGQRCSAPKAAER